MLNLFTQMAVLDDFTKTLIKVIAYIAPYFLIPLTFKFGLGVFGNLAGMVNDRSRGFFDRQRKARENSRAGARQRAREGQRFAGGNAENRRGRLNRGIANTLNAPSAIMESGSVGSPRNWAGATRARSSALNAAAIERTKKENGTYQTWMHDDDINRAASESHDEDSLRAALTRADARTVAAGGTARFTSPAAMNDTVARVQSVRRSMNSDAFRQLTTEQAIAGGTAYATAGEAWEAVARAAGNDDAALGRLVAAGRSSSMQAGRVDVGGAGFGDTLGAVQTMQQELVATGTVSAATRDAATETILQGAIDSSAPNQVVYGKPNSARQLAQAHSNRINRLITEANTAHAGVAAGTHTQAQADVLVDNAKQAMASAAGVYDAMQSASPQNARAFANGLTGTGFVTSSLPPALAADFGATGTTVSIIDAMDSLRA